MISSVSFAGQGVTNYAPVRSSRPNNTASIVEIRPKVDGTGSQDKGIVIDGKVYLVKKANYSPKGIMSILPMKRDVVEIDGKQYPVEKVHDRICCDRQKEVVVVDGKQYDVQDNLGTLADMQRMQEALQKTKEFIKYTKECLG